MESQSGKRRRNPQRLMKYEDPRMYEWMTPKELAAFFHKSHRTIKRYRAMGFTMAGHRQTPAALSVWMLSRGVGSRKRVTG